MLTIAHPPGYDAERRYAFSVVLGTFLGLAYRAREADRSDVCITLDGDDARALVLPDGLFQTPTDRWLAPDSLPAEPLARCEGAEDDLPVVFGAGGPRVSEADRCLELAVDVFGSAFFLLTRYEELARPERDEHDRFPARASLAWRAGFLERPLVDEYVELLWTGLQRLWPGLRRSLRRFELSLSHDVDWPLCANDWAHRVFKSALGDVARRRAPGLALRRLRAWRQAQRGRFEADPCNTFDWIMDESERHGLKSAFYFIADHTAGRRDGTYSLDDPWIRGLMQRIHRRGHEIGLHPSYGTYQDAVQTKREFDALKRACEAEGVEQDRWGGRQHYLRWQNPVTWRNWEEAGLDYDSTLGFADHVGFRCGTAHEFPVFDLEQRQSLSLRERPLVAMERTLLADKYMGLNANRAYGRMLKLADACRQTGGRFTVLWHNNLLLTCEARRPYRALVRTMSI